MLSGGLCGCVHRRLLAVVGRLLRLRGDRVSVVEEVLGEVFFAELVVVKALVACKIWPTLVWEPAKRL